MAFIGRLMPTESARANVVAIACVLLGAAAVCGLLSFGARVAGAATAADTSSLSVFAPADALQIAQGPPDIDFGDAQPASQVSANFGTLTGGSYRAWKLNVLTGSYGAWTLSAQAAAFSNGIVTFPVDSLKLDASSASWKRLASGGSDHGDQSNLPTYTSGCSTTPGCALDHGSAVQVAASNATSPRSVGILAGTFPASALTLYLPSIASYPSNPFSTTITWTLAQQ